MHRVELKVFGFKNSLAFKDIVPNAPCGVERTEIQNLFHNQILHVPNAPCGVERTQALTNLTGARTVPNAPCGVERLSEKAEFSSFPQCS